MSYEVIVDDGQHTTDDGRWTSNNHKSGELKSILFNYTLHGVGLKETDSAKYLGVNILRDLLWAKHINQITMKTKNFNQLKFIKRNIQTKTLN